MNDLNIHFVLVVAGIVGALSTGRLTRLLVNDTYPPMKRVRALYLRMIRGNEEWAPLVECPWCAAPYFAAPILAWAVLSELHWSWWVVNGWLALSYVASWIVFHDEDGEG